MEEIGTEVLNELWKAIQQNLDYLFMFIYFFSAWLVTTIFKVKNLKGKALSKINKVKLRAKKIYITLIVGVVVGIVFFWLNSYGKLGVEEMKDKILGLIISMFATILINHILGISKFVNKKLLHLEEDK